ncbi:MAG: helix-turn-helix transcriptional regulator [Oceanospirillaceae bacterium]|nr:helix-turn-helix transcriptional regulator [Oceanospirillaceae bacterium]
MKKIDLETPPSQSWHRDLALLIGHNRSRNFPEVMNESLSHLVRFDANLTATYKGSYKPIEVFSTHSGCLKPPLEKYLNEYYMLDPVFNSIRKGLPAGVYRLQEITPDAIVTTDYYRLCYQEFDPGDEIILVIPLEHGVVFTIALGRHSSLGAISRAERHVLNSIFPVISALVQQFWIAQSGAFLHDERTSNTLERALSSFGSGVLTRREQEITGLVLQGYSSKSIAEQLHISSGTVKVHRRNIYARLSISTQSELFSIFLDHLGKLEEP